MARVAIDVDRGVSIRQVVRFANEYKFTPDPTYGGMAVYMYKDTPGVYYDVHGRVIPEGIAKMAGFPVDRLAKERKKKEAIAALDARLRQELELELGVEEVLAEAGDWKVVALPMDRAKVVDKETGEAVTAVPLAVEHAMELLRRLTETAEEVKSAPVATSSRKGTSNGSSAS